MFWRINEKIILILANNTDIMKILTGFIISLTLLAACGGQKGADDGGSQKKGRGEEMEVSKVTPVSVKRLTATEFSHEIVSNGKATGHERADLRFAATDAVITEVYVKNGSHVAKGTRLARLDDLKLREKAEQARTALAKAELELKDALIGQGFDPDDFSAVPSDIMKLARLRSGYTEAEANLVTVERDLSETVLTAPFAGTVANVSGKPWNRPDGSKPFCTLIGQTMDVSFNILESELPLLAIGDRVEVSPYSSSAVYQGRIAEINPVVDENGLVEVTATVGNGKCLADGMNVKVSVQKSVGRQLVVPKSAVVLRTGRQVVFTLDESGKRAMWNYVQTGLENFGEYTITDGLEEGMDVIVDGNVNLAHESPVSVVKK